MDRSPITEGQILKNDLELLAYLRGFRVLTVSQLADLSQRSPQVIRRRLRVLAAEGLIVSRQRAYGNRRGRPEDLVLLTRNGWRAIHGGKLDKPKDLQDEKAAASYLVDHELLLNWTLIHLIRIERRFPQFTVQYVTQYFSSIEANTPATSLTRIRVPDKSGEVTFVPDSIFIISDTPSKKSLLFFLEVDMGTETVISPKKGLNDIRQKILNYQNLYRSSRYKRFEGCFKSAFKGFRLLIVTSTAARFTRLCQLTASMPPSDFIWLTNQDRMFTSGLSAAIWARGGRSDNAGQSILGTRLVQDRP